MFSPWTFIGVIFSAHSSLSVHLGTFVFMSQPWDAQFWCVWWKLQLAAVICSLRAVNWFDSRPAGVLLWPQCWVSACTVQEKIIRRASTSTMTPVELEGRALYQVYQNIERAVCQIRSGQPVRAQNRSVYTALWIIPVNVVKLSYGRKYTSHRLFREGVFDWLQ